MARKLVLGASALVSGMVLAVPAFAQEMISVAEESFDQVDANASGSISLTEFRNTVQGTNNPATVFSGVDVDQNGQVSRGEWDRWRAQQTAATTTDSEADELEAGTLDDQIEVALSTNSLRGEYLTDADMIGLDGNRLGFGALLSDDNDIVLSGSLMAPGLLDDINVVPEYLTLSLGGKAYAAMLADPDDDVFGVAPGAEARWLIPLFGLQTWAVGSIFYAPDIITFGDAEDILDFSATYEVQFLEGTVGFAGYRMLRFDRDTGGDELIDSNIQVGLRFEF